MAMKANAMARQNVLGGPTRNRPDMNG